MDAIKGFMIWGLFLTRMHLRQTLQWLKEIKTKCTFFRGKTFHECLHSRKALGSSLWDPNNQFAKESSTWRPISCVARRSLFDVLSYGGRWSRNLSSFCHRCFSKLSAGIHNINNLKNELQIKASFSFLKSRPYLMPCLRQNISHTAMCWPFLVQFKRSFDPRAPEKKFEMLVHFEILL